MIRTPPMLLDIWFKTAEGLERLMPVRPSSVAWVFSILSSLNLGSAGQMQEVLLDPSFGRLCLSTSYGTSFFRSTTTHRGEAGSVLTSGDNVLCWYLESTPIRTAQLPGGEVIPTLAPKVIYSRTPRLMREAWAHSHGLSERPPRKNIRSRHNLS